MNDDIDWSRPIRALPYGASLMSSAERQPKPTLDFQQVRDEQLRRAALLLQAAGSRQKATATRVALLAETVPGMRWSSGRLVYRSLAPERPLLMAPFAGQAGLPRRPGRPVTWPSERLEALLERVEQFKKESARPLTDDHALARVQKESIAIAKQRAEAAGPVFDNAARAGAEMPEIETLRNYLAKARAARR